MLKSALSGCKCQKVLRGGESAKRHASTISSAQMPTTIVDGRKGTRGGGYDGRRDAVARAVRCVPTRGDQMRAPVASSVIVVMNASVMCAIVRSVMYDICSTVICVVVP